ncbi:phenylalanine--tRNA ligase subunit beta [Dehalococcoidia bacterium]|nr:phenylalanine--tRNA ligase subunit beta [Dehalococcoidia bacterium]
MKIPLSWLREYVSVTISPKEVCRQLTLAGLEAGSITTIGENWDNILVGYVTSVNTHPSADLLKLVTVDIGSDSLTVVCGAPNVADGQYVAFAKIGARVADPDTGHMTILKEARIRGINSQGMICSEKELGVGSDHTGILVLGEAGTAGMPLIDHLGDSVLDLDVTPNRPDWLSVLGVAHEIAALSGGTVTEPALYYPETKQSINRQITIKLDDPDLAPRYTATLITDVRVGPSPQWMQDRLRKAGQRSINNIVDITNYVMLEYGQPLHAFDYETLEDNVVRVRRATAGETLITLDGVSLNLSSDMLVIADARRPIGLAGIMGGANSEMTDSTTKVLLESANFNPSNIRRTSASVKLRTEASIRFERGLNPEIAPIALRRATQLIHELAHGQITQGIIDLYPNKQEHPKLRLAMKKVEKVLGLRISSNKAGQALLSLGFEFKQVDGDTLLVSIPYWRSDIAIEEDLIEEIARTIGYDTIPTTFLSQGIPPHHPQPMRKLKEQVKDILVAAGMQEVISYPLTSHDMLKKTGALMDGPLRVANPMSVEQEYMRTTLRGSLLATLATNQRFGQTGLRMFEVGRVYHPRKDSLPDEREIAMGILWGDRFPMTWVGGNGTIDFFDAKGVVESLMDELNIRRDFGTAIDPLLHEGSTGSILASGKRIGVVGEFRHEVLEGFGIHDGPVAMFEIDLETLLSLLPDEPRRFIPLAKFPGAHRDIALLVDTHIPMNQLESIIRKHLLVQNVTVFDLFMGAGVPDGKRSLAIRINFQSPDHTLTSEEINSSQEKILRDLDHQTGAYLRE